VTEHLQKAVSSALKAGYQLDKEAFNFLENLSRTEDPIAIIEKAVKKAQTLSQKPLFIGRSLLEELLAEETKKPVPTTVYISPPLPETKKTRFQPYAKEVDPDIKIIEDPTEKICTMGSIQDYLEYFQDRFRRLEKILRQRIDIKNAMPISEALKAPRNSKVKVIGMLTEKRESKHRIFFKIEDMSGAATVLVPQGVEEAIRAKAQMLLVDQVVCFIAVKSRNDLLVLEDVLFPEIPQRRPRKAPIPVYAALISDLHVGSKLFMREEFNRFLLWLNGKLGDAYKREMAGKIKYVIIIHEARKVHSLGNPCTISLHNVELLVYHGRSLDDIIATAPNQSFKEPEKAMKLLLQCRHLAPIYGQKTPISPENRDFMVIERIPDIFHTGHIHVERHETYRGVLSVNSGAWQGQTAFQKKMGLEPTPGIVPIVDLQTLQVFTVNFKSTTLN